MTNIKWSLAHSGNSKFISDSDDLIEEKALKTDVIYSVVILNSSKIKDRLRYIQNDSSNMMHHDFLEKRNFKKRRIETKVSKILNMDFYLHTENEVNEKLFHKKTSRKKKQATARNKKLLKLTQESFIKEHAYILNEKTYIKTEKNPKIDTLLNYKPQPKNALLSKRHPVTHNYRTIENQSTTNIIKNKISNMKSGYLLKGIYEIEQKIKISIISQQYISEANTFGYLKGTHHLINNLVKPSISLVEEKNHLTHNGLPHINTLKSRKKEKYRDEFFEKMDDQASSIEIFNLNDARCIERFLKILGED